MNYDKGYKLPLEYTNFLDNRFYGMASKLDDTFVNLNMTPNKLTTISFLLGILSVYFSSGSRFALSGVFYVLSYMFDCFDGYFARKHDMITVFGDWYDHITDWLVVLLLCYVIYKNKNINSKSKLYAFSGLILMFAFSAIFVGCEQKFNNNPNPSLKIFESACKDDIDYNLTTFKDVSMGTLTIYIFLVLLVFQYSKQL